MKFVSLHKVVGEALFQRAPVPFSAQVLSNGSVNSINLSRKYKVISALSDDVENVIRSHISHNLYAAVEQNGPLKQLLSQLDDSRWSYHPENTTSDMNNLMFCEKYASRMLHLYVVWKSDKFVLSQDSDIRRSSWRSSRGPAPAFSSIKTFMERFPQELEKHHAVLNKSADYFLEMSLAAGGDFECDAEPFLKSPDSDPKKLCYSIIVRGYEWKVTWGGEFTVEPQKNEVIEFIRNMPDRAKVSKASPPPSK